MIACSAAPHPPPSCHAGARSRPSAPQTHRIRRAGPSRPVASFPHRRSPTEPLRRSSSGENHGSGNPKMESPPFSPSDGGLGLLSRRRNLDPGEAAVTSGVGWPPWPCPRARRGQGRLMRLAQSSWTSRPPLAQLPPLGVAAIRSQGPVPRRPTSIFGPVARLNIFKIQILFIQLNDSRNYFKLTKSVETCSTLRKCKLKIVGIPVCRPAQKS
jgi:hypothetical protein